MEGGSGTGCREAEAGPVPANQRRHRVHPSRHATRALRDGQAITGCLLRSGSQFYSL